MSEFENRYKKAVDEMEAHNKKAAEYKEYKKGTAFPTYDPTDILTPRNSHTDALRKKLIENMEKAKNERKQEEQYTRITDPVNILILPIVQCAECLHVYQIDLESDGIRLRFRHQLNEKCSRQMTQFHRPLAVFMKEI